MKKNILSVAVASGVAGLALNAQAAMYLNPEGTGEVLLFPYYNAQNGNETSMHIVNTTDDAKAIKVRFMGVCELARSARLQPLHVGR